MIASLDVDPEHEALINEVYDQEHIPNLSKVLGVRGGDPLQAGRGGYEIGGERKTMNIGDAFGCSAIFELESPDVLTSPEWARAVEEGCWPQQVRPYTRNRHVLLTIIKPR